MDTNALKETIRSAFEHTPPPPGDSLCESHHGDEPSRIDDEFRGKRRWQSIPRDVLDGAPGGLGSALSFFTAEAFRFYIPAYMIADVDGILDKADPVFSLTHGFTESSGASAINPKLYGKTTWEEHARRRFALFSPQEAMAVRRYLEFKAAIGLENERLRISEALEHYWIERSRGGRSS